MKRLNFFPYYRELVEAGSKTTTIRLTNREGFEPGDKVAITIGWDLDSSQHVRDGKIERVYTKRVSELTAKDFEGESPDCQEPVPTAMVLGAIYRKVVELDDEVVVVKFRYE